MNVFSKSRFTRRSVHGKILDMTKGYHLNDLRIKLVKVMRSKKT
jgi:hypothetical protein